MDMMNGRKTDGCKPAAAAGITDTLKGRVLTDSMAEIALYGRFARLLQAVESGLIPLNTVKVPPGVSVKEALVKAVSLAEAQGMDLSAERKKLNGSEIQTLREDVWRLAEAVEKRDSLERMLGADASDISIAMCYALPPIKGIIAEICAMEQMSKSQIPPPVAGLGPL